MDSCQTRGDTPQSETKINSSWVPRHLKWSGRSSLGFGAKFGRGVTELGTLQLLYFVFPRARYSILPFVFRRHTPRFCKPAEGQEVSFSKERRHFNGTFSITHYVMRYNSHSSWKCSRNTQDEHSQ